MSESKTADELDEQTIEILARQRGLQLILDAHRADLVKALALVQKCRQALDKPLTLQAEPWPAMQPYIDQD